MKGKKDDTILQMWEKKLKECSENEDKMGGVILT